MNINYYKESLRLKSFLEQRLMSLSTKEAFVLIKHKILIKIYAPLCILYIYNNKKIILLNIHVTISDKFHA